MPHRVHEAAVLDAAEQTRAVFGDGAADLLLAETVVIGEIFHVGSDTYIRFLSSTYKCNFLGADNKQ